MKKYCTFPDQSKFELIFCVEHPNGFSHVKYEHEGVIQEIFVPNDFINNG